MHNAVGGVLDGIEDAEEEVEGGGDGEAERLNWTEE